jgi:hypothetical protein
MGFRNQRREGGGEKEKWHEPVGIIHRTAGWKRVIFNLCR